MKLFALQRSGRVRKSEVHEGRAGMEVAKKVRGLSPAHLQDRWLEHKFGSTFRCSFDIKNVYEILVKVHQSRGGLIAPRN